MPENNILLLEQIIRLALDKVYQDDLYLIEERVHERSVVFRVGLYLIELLKQSPFRDYDLDFEYNRDHSEPKRTRNFPNGTYPDLILHRRGDNESNKVIMEFKTWSNVRPNNKETDLSKLKDFTDQRDKYKYKLGMFILLNKTEPEIIKINNGVVHN